MEQTISLKQALEIIDTLDVKGEAYPFNISFRSLNRKSKTGGKLYTYNNVKKQINTASKPNLLRSAQSEVLPSKNPNHYKNRTRNLVLQNGDVKKIHIRLIISINGNKVVY